MVFTLALKLGKYAKDVLENMSVSEFKFWLAYDHLEPIGDYRQDVTQGYTTLMIQNFMNMFADTKTKRCIADYSLSRYVFPEATEENCDAYKRLMDSVRENEARCKDLNNGV